MVFVVGLLLVLHGFLKKIYFSLSGRLDSFKFDPNIQTLQDNIALMGYTTTKVKNS